MTRIGFATTIILLSAHVASADPQRYSLPWELQALTDSNVARVDSAAAAFTDPHGNVDIAESTILSGSYQLTERWAPTLRLGFVGNNAPGAVNDGFSLINPVVGATYTRPLGRYRFALALATALPLGTGDARAATARPADDAMFQVDYLTTSAAVDIAYVTGHVTAQAEAALLPSIRVRGDHGDRFELAAALGLHAGYFFGSHVSLGADVRYQDSLTVAVGPRVHLRAGAHARIHPGLSLTRGFDSRGLDAPMITSHTTAVQIDVPVTF